MSSPALTAIHELSIEIGEMPILVRTDSAEFAHLLEDRYGEFVSADTAGAAMELEIRLVEAGVGSRESGVGQDDTPRLVIRDSDPGPRTLDSGLRTPDPESRAPNPGSRMPDLDADLSVRREAGRWIMERGDFRAEWDPECRRGWIRQTANPYAIDGVLRILHSLILAREGGFLVHAASAVRNGRAFVFAGISGTGKTTISRLAPADVTLLTDEISYVRGEEQVSGARCQVSGVGSGEEVSGARCQVSGVGRQEAEAGISDSRFKIQDSESLIAHGRQPTANIEQENPSSVSRTPNPEPRVSHPESRTTSPESRVANPVSLTPDTWHLTPAFSAYGTPFAGELARIGQKVRAPLATLFLLQQGPENRIEPVSEGQAVRELMRHVLFFAQDEELVGMIFQTVCDFVRRVPVRRLVFKKDASVWELIG